MDSDKVSAETTKYEITPSIIDFTDDKGEDIMAEQIGNNGKQMVSAEGDDGLSIQHY